MNRTPARKLQMAHVVQRALGPLRFPGKTTLLRSFFANLQADVVTRVPAGFLMRLNTASPAEWNVFFGTTEWAESDLMAEALTSDAAFIDVGANVGYYSLFAARRAGRVLAFEPLHRNFDRLSENIRLNGLTNVETYRIAAGDRDGEAAFYLPGDESGTAWGSLAPGREVAGIWHGPSTMTETVQVRMLDSIVDGASRLKLVKIDVEGFEPEVLRGMENLLKRHRPWVVCEVNCILLGMRGLDAGAVFDFMEARGYRAHKIGRYRTSKERLHASKVEPVQNVLFRPDA